MNRSNQKLSRPALGLILLAALFNIRGVNLKNGNFYVSYTDVVAGKLDITRTFNSKSSFYGPFGVSWSMYYFTYLVPMPSGTIVMNNFGGGDRRYFLPEKLSETDIENEIRLILDVKIAEGLLKTDAETEQLRRRLKNSLSYRSVEYERLLMNGKLAPVILPPGHTAINDRNNAIKVTADGYEAPKSTGEIAFFNRQGKLVRLNDEKGETAVSYDIRGNLYRISHSDGDWVKFKYDNLGHIIRIWSNKMPPASYRYDNRGALVWSKDVAGNIYQYAYDDNINMTKVRYEDGSEMKITYDPKTYFVNSVTDRFREKYIYNYGTFDDDPDRHYYSETTKLSAEGDTVVNRYEYTIAKDSLTGNEFTAAIKAIINRRDTTVTAYRPGGNVINITHNGVVIHQLYYNRQGDVIRAETHKGKKYLIDYNKEGFVSSVVEPGVGQFQFIYGNIGQLSHIILPDGRSIPYPVAEMVQYRDANYKALEDLMEASGSFTSWFNCECKSGKKICEGGSGLSDYNDLVQGSYRSWPSYVEYFKCVSENTLVDSLRKPYMATAAKLLRNYNEKTGYPKTMGSTYVYERVILYCLLAGEYTEALAWINKIREHSPENPWAKRYEPLVPLFQGNWEQARVLYEKYADAVPGHGYPGFFEFRHYARWDMREVYLKDIGLLADGRYLSKDLVEKARDFLRTESDWGDYYAWAADTAAVGGQQTELRRKSAHHFEKAYSRQTPGVLLHLLTQHERLGNEAPETAFALLRNRETMATLAEYYGDKAEVSEDSVQKRDCLLKSSEFYKKLCLLFPQAPERVQWIAVQEALGDRVDYAPFYKDRDVESLYAAIGFFLDKAGEYAKQEETRLAFAQTWFDVPWGSVRANKARDTTAFAAADSLRSILYGVVTGVTIDTASVPHYDRFATLTDRFLNYTEKDTLKSNYRVSLYRQKIALLERLEQLEPGEVKWKKNIVDTYFPLNSILLFDQKDYQAFHNSQIEQIARAERYIGQYPKDEYFKEYLENRHHDAALGCFYLRKLDEAIEHSKLVVKYRLDESNYFYANGRIVYAHLLSGRYDEAKAYYEQVKELQDKGKSMADWITERMDAYCERAGTDPNDPDVKRFLEYLKGRE